MSNLSEKFDMAIGGRPNVTPFILGVKGTVRNTSLDLIGFTSGAAQRGEIPYPAEGTTEVFQVASTNVNDTLLGSGANTVTILFLDANSAIQTFIADLNGQTPVNIPAAFRILTASIRTGGTIATPASNKSAGTITVGQNFTLGVAADVYLQIDPVLGQSMLGAFTIPKDHRGIFTAAFASGPKGADIEFATFTRQPGGRQWNSLTGFFSAESNDFSGFTASAFGPGSDFELRAQSDTANAEIRMLFNFILVPTA